MSMVCAINNNIAQSNNLLKLRVFLISTSLFALTEFCQKSLHILPHQVHACVVMILQNNFHEQD